MRRPRGPSRSLLCLLLAAPVAIRPAAAAADLVLLGGAVYTVDAARSWAEAVAVEKGRIVYVGPDAGARGWIGPATRVVALDGRMVLPAFQDAHVHPMAAGIELGQCDLNGLDSERAVLDRVASCAAGLGPGAWLVGGGWDLPLFPQANPTRELLDLVAGDRPALLSAADGHSAWVSSRALAAAGITAATPDPPGGHIERRAGSGEPSGTLREAAIDLVRELTPKPDLEQRLAGLRRAQETLHGFGVTAVADASVEAADLEAYRAAEARSELALRVVACLHVDPRRGLEQVPELAALRQRLASPLVRPTEAKIFVDGVVEAHTAAMLEPYLDRPGERGEPLWSAADLDAMVAGLVAAGFDVHFHAIGDRAIRLALDAVEASRGTAGPAPERPPRHQISHLEVIDPADIPRLRRLGVVANFQALWAYADSYIRDLTWPLLGAARSRWIYPIASVARAGGPLAFGSDWSVSSPNPLLAIQVAVTRLGPDGEGGEPLTPEEAIDLPTALAAYTIGAAWANGLERESGSIEVGKSADLVVLSADLFDLPPEEIGRARVLMTLFAGRPVWEAAEVGGAGLGTR